MLFGETPFCHLSLWHSCVFPLCSWSWDGGSGRGLRNEVREKGSVGDTHKSLHPCLCYTLHCFLQRVGCKWVPAMLLRWGGPTECYTELLLMSLKTQLGRKLGMEQLTKIKLRALRLILN